MPLRNRVTPLAELIATPERGLVYGNRGCLHDAGGSIGRRYNGKRWIACQLHFRGGRAQVITPPSLVEMLRHGWAPVVPLIHPSAK
jgi:hypothetical protein